MAIRTRLTEFFGLQHPIVLAPMTPAAEADLASAVSEAGGLGLLGGGYAERAWFMAEAAKVTRPHVGCGFITWALARDPDLYDEALARFPRAMMLSFADPAPLARRARDAGRAFDLSGPYAGPGPACGRCRGQRCCRPRNGGRRAWPGSPIDDAVCACRRRRRQPP